MLITPIFHVVLKGHTPGIYTSYQKALEQVKDFDGYKIRDYPTIEKARNAWNRYQYIARNKDFPIPKNTLSRHSINFNAKDTVVLTSVSDPDNSSFTIHQKECRRHEAFDCKFNQTKAEGSMLLSSFCQLLITARDILDIDSSKVITIFCSPGALNQVSKIAPIWEANNWLTRSGNAPKNIEQVKVAYLLFHQLKSRVYFQKVGN
jgi:ribonuclease HI